MRMLVLMVVTAAMMTAPRASVAAMYRFPTLHELQDKCIDLKDEASCIWAGATKAADERTRSEGEDQLKKLCDQGGGLACLLLARHYESLGNKKDAEKLSKRGNELLQPACEQGDAGACWQLGEGYVNGFGGEEWHEKAREYLSKGCELGRGEACLEMAQLYPTGSGARMSDLEEIDRLLARACSLDVSDGENCRLAGVYSERMWNKDEQTRLAQAKDYYEKSCGKSNAAGCLDLAVRVGLDSKNKAVMRDYLDKAAELDRQGYVLNEVVGEYLSAWSKDDTKLGEKVERYLRKSCELNNAEGCLMTAAYLAGEIPYIDGGKREIKKDNEDVGNYLDKACELDKYGEVCRRAGIDLWSDEWFSDRKEKAAKAFIKSCELGDSSGCGRAATYFEQRSDSVKVEYYLGRGCEMYDRYGRFSDGEPCYRLAAFYLMELTEKNKDKLDKLLDGYCSKERSDHCYDIGGLFSGYAEIVDDKDRAVHYLEIGCNGGSSLDCRKLGDIYADETYQGRDMAQAASYYQRSCDLGNCNDAAGALQKLVATGQFTNSGQVTDMYTQGCDAGEKDSCLSLGRLYQRGVIVKQDSDKALALFERYCASNEKYCAEGADEIIKNPAKQQNYDGAVQLYKKSCENAKNAWACRSLGNLYDEGKVVKKNSSEAAKYHDMACEGGSTNSCFIQGLRYEKDNDGVKRDDRKAAEYYEKGCNVEHGGDGGACNNLGWMYQEGRGVERDTDKAFALYKKGCDLYDSYACNNLGDLYAEAQGLARDVKKAIELWSKTCEWGDGRGCTSLGELYAKGNGVTQDFGQANEMYEKACNLKNGWGCFVLAENYKKGQGVKKSSQQYTHFLDLACQNGSSAGCNNLGVCYVNGEGVKRNIKTAKNYYKRACDMGNETACGNLRNLK